MEYTYLLPEDKGEGIVLLTLNRPEKLNALDDNAWLEIQHYFTEVDTDPSVRVVIITGAGDKAFAAGADLNSLLKKKPATVLGSKGQKALAAIEACSKPVIAAVNGYAFGGGCELSLACDFRVAADTALFALPETSLGILPGAGGTQRLSRLIGMGRAKEMIMLGKKIKGADAVNIGLATSCVPFDQLMDEALKTAHKLLKIAPISLQVSKQVIQMSMSSSIDVGM